MRRAGAVKGVTQGKIQFDVAGLSLTPQVRNDASVVDVWVEVDLLDNVDQAQMRTKPMRKAASLDFGFSHSVAVPAGGSVQQELAKALKSTDEQEADVYFALKTRSATGERELGQGYVNLHALLRDAKNIMSSQIDLQGKGGQSAGTLTVSVLGLEALQAARAGPTSSVDAFIGGSKAGAEVPG